MKRISLVALVLSLIATTSAQANDLWLDRSGPPLVSVPSLAPLVSASEPAVLSIYVEGSIGNSNDPRMDWMRRFGVEMPDMKRQGQGTGFLIHPDGYAITNFHVVEGASEINVKVGNGSALVPADVVGEDARTDIALIRLRGTAPSGGWPALPLGDSERLTVGDFVVAIGNPFGLAQSVSMGIVSAKGRRDIAPSGRHGLYDFLQTDAAINPGNSGGPLVNFAGEVVGVNAAVNAAGQGLGFAIPINLVKQMLPDLKAKGRVERGYLGVALGKVSDDVAAGLGLDRARGALVVSVNDGTPAWKAGLEPGDVITKFDDKPVEAASDLPLFAAAAGVGRKVVVELVRDGELRSATILLQKRPDDESSKPRAAKKPKARTEPAARIGIFADDVDDEYRARLGLKDNQDGVVIVRVENGSIAAEAGIEPGDVVVKLNGKPMDDADKFVRAVERSAAGSVLKLVVLRGGTPTFVVMRKP
jgi:serine protease Do